jgi:hypothetical protein
MLASASVGQRGRRGCWLQPASRQEPAEAGSHNCRAFITVGLSRLETSSASALDSAIVVDAGFSQRRTARSSWMLASASVGQRDRRGCWLQPASDSVVVVDAGFSQRLDRSRLKPAPTTVGRSRLSGVRDCRTVTTGDILRERARQRDRRGCWLQPASGHVRLKPDATCESPPAPDATCESPPAPDATSESPPPPDATSESPHQ